MARSPTLLVLRYFYSFWIDVFDDIGALQSMIKFGQGVNATMRLRDVIGEVKLSAVFQSPQHIQHVVQRGARAIAGHLGHEAPLDLQLVQHEIHVFLDADGIE